MMVKCASLIIINYIIVSCNIANNQFRIDVRHIVPVSLSYIYNSLILA